MEIIESYIKILEEQHKLFVELFTLAKLKQPVLINGEIEELDKITKKEQKIIIQVGRLEEERYPLHQALANHFCLLPEELDAHKLITLLDEEDKNIVKEMIINLQQTINQLDLINQENTSLTEQSLEFVNYSLNLLTGLDDSPTYGDNNTNNKTIAKIFDQKI